MTPQETEQFAALRMQVAHLHNALSEAVAHQVASATGPIPENLQRWSDALTQSEPEVKDLLAEADRDAKLVAARADAKEARDELAKSTARLARIEEASRKVVEAAAEWDLESGAAAVEASIDVLAEALK